MWSIKDKLDTDILILKSSDTIMVARDLLIDQELYRLPVVENGKVLYMVELSSLADHNDDEVLSEIADIQLTVFPSARSEQHFFEALQTMINEDRMLSLPVLGEGNDYVGMVRLKDLTSNYIPQNFLTEQASLIVLEMEEHEYSMTNIANIVEYNRCRILQSLAVVLENRKMWVQLIVNSTTIQSIIAGFERYDYTIIFTQNQMDGKSPLEDQYKSLLKYLDL